MTKQREGMGKLLWPVLLLGLAADLLFQTDALGLNVALWLAGAVVAWWIFRQQEGARPGAAERGLLLGLLALGFAAMWRENPLLRFLDAVALVVSAAVLPLAAAPTGAMDFWNLSLGRLATAMLRLLRRGLMGLTPMLLDASRTSREQRTGLAPTVASVARGALLSVPALLLFGGLLGHADPVFGDFLKGLVRFDIDRLANHSLVILIASWVAAAFLHGTIAEERATVAGDAVAIGAGLGRVEVGMLLGLLNLLFAAFIAFQLPYFFGGASWVERTAGITLAEYARKGFFELVAVSALVLPLLLVLHAQLRAGEAATPRLYRSLAAWQVVLVLIIMASAIHRMALYQQEFGLTEDRFFASAVMAGLAVTFCWFGMTVLRDRAEHFAAGALVAWAGWLVLLHVINPERVIVETNLARAASGKPLDTRYLTQLTSDASPALVAGIRRMPAAQQGAVVLMLRSQAATLDHGWRAWHFGRAEARRSIVQLDRLGPIAE